jgi:hypothetical protein
MLPVILLAAMLVIIAPVMWLFGHGPATYKFDLTIPASGYTEVVPGLTDQQCQDMINETLKELTESHPALEFEMGCTKE